jgi:hypothetical protein
MTSITRRLIGAGYSLAPVLPVLATALVLFALLAADTSAATKPSATYMTLPAHGGSTSSATRPDPGGSGSLGGVLAGLTSQRWPALLEVTPDGRMVSRAFAALDLRCTSGLHVLITDPWVVVPIKPNGTFKDSFSDSFVQGGVSVSVSDSISGKLNRNRSQASVKFGLRMTMQAPDGSSDSCDSGNVTLHARD